MIQKNIQKLVIALLVILASQTAVAQIEANLNILNDQLVMPMLHALDSVYSPGHSIQIVSSINNDMGQWVEQRLRSELLKKDIPLYVENKNFGEPLYTLILQSLGAEIYYIPISKNMFLRNNKYQRNIETILSYYIKENDESIIYSYSKTDQMLDTLKTSQLKGIENKFYDFTKGDKVESGWIRKYLEPALITITTIGVVYLFYSLRSG